MRFFLSILSVPFQVSTMRVAVAAHADTQDYLGYQPSLLILPFEMAQVLISETHCIPPNGVDFFLSQRLADSSCQQ